MATAVLARLGDGDRNGCFVADMALLDGDGEALWHMVCLRRGPSRRGFIAFFGDSVCGRDQASRAKRLVHCGVNSSVCWTGLRG